MEVPARTNDHHSIVVHIFFLVEYLENNNNKILLCDGFAGAMDLGSPEPKDRHLFLPKSQMKDPESIAGKIMVEYNSKAVSYVHM